MIKSMTSKRAAIRFAIRTYGPDWQIRARYLKVDLPENGELHVIQSKEQALAEDRAEREAAWATKQAQSKAASAESITHKVWAICDILRKANPKITRKGILEECVRQGIQASTAATQYQRWRKARQADAPQATQPQSH